MKQIIAAGLMAATALYGDFTYEETSKITGGAIVGMMKFAGAFSKDARHITDPTVSTIAIQGNRMVRKSKLDTTITDLDAETITTINNEKKTYSVMTFAQMKQMMEDASKQMNEAQAKQQHQQQPANQAPPPDVKFDVKVKDLGNTKTINGLNAHEMLITMTMEATDQQSGQKGGMEITTNSWLAPRIPGYEQVREFYMRMAAKLGWVPGGAGMMNRPDIMKGMAEVYKESAKMDGVPVLQIVRMGGSMDGQNGAQGDGRQQQQQQQQSSSSNSAPPTSVGSAIGSALGGRFGLGGRKKKDQDQPPADANNANGSASGSLMEMTVELSTYSSAPVDNGMFAIPAGFKKVEVEAMSGARRGR